MIKLKRPIIAAVIIALSLSPAGAALGREARPLEVEGFKLRGTAVSGVFEPIAIIEDTKSNKSYWYKRGDTFNGGRITDIKRGYILLEIGNRLYVFGLPKGAVISGEEIIVPDAAKKTALRLGKKRDDNIWEIKLSSAIDMLARTSEIMKDARIRPHFAVGKASGIKIDRIKQGSVIDKMGFADGDVVKGVNGFGLMRPNKIFDAYRKYRNDRTLHVQILRNNEPTTLTYNIVR
jgi:general secretion pathway protein C